MSLGAEGMILKQFLGHRSSFSFGTVFQWDPCDLICTLLSPLYFHPINAHLICCSIGTFFKLTLSVYISLLELFNMQNWGRNHTSFDSVGLLMLGTIFLLAKWSISFQNLLRKYICGMSFPTLVCIYRFIIFRIQIFYGHFILENLVQWLDQSI